jgi:hypothetical protein
MEPPAKIGRKYGSSSRHDVASAVVQTSYERMKSAGKKGYTLYFRLISRFASVISMH